MPSKSLHALPACTPNRFSVSYTDYTEDELLAMLAGTAALAAAAATAVHGHHQAAGANGPEADGDLNGSEDGGDGGPEDGGDGNGLQNQDEGDQDAQRARAAA